jgi:tetratricopeptide (TPR) repeat protein
MRDLKQLMEQGKALIAQKKPQQALLYFSRAMLLAPQSSEVLLDCAKTLMELNRSAEAVIYTERALALCSTPETASLHAKALYQMGCYAQALHYFEQVLAVTPQDYTALTQRALCLTQVNRYDEALSAYQQALQLSNNQDAWVGYNYSLCLLAMGHLFHGFTFYEYRWLVPLAAKRRHWVFPELMSKEALQGKSILIYSEQGLGDNIQFFRYIPYLVALGVRVVLEISPRLVPLFSAWEQSITLIATGERLPVADYHCPIQSLARLFKTELSTIPCSIPYVFPVIPQLANYQKKRGHFSRKRIGFAWKGSTNNSMNQKRSMELKDLLAVHHAAFDFICLQQEVFLEEKVILDHYDIPYQSLELSTLAGTATLIASLDIVITVDTAIAHLAGAMGKPVWVLLPFSADWRWFLEREDSPWYPQITLFRQVTFGDWSVPLVRIQQALAALHPARSQIVVEDYLLQADRQLQQGLLPQAEQLYRSILMQTPDCHRAAHGVALAALQQHKLADAIQFMQRAVEIDPTVGIYRRNLGELLRRVGQLEAAIAAHSTVIAAEPYTAENHYLLAIAYNDHRQYALAVQHYRLALSYDPQHGMAWNNLGASLEVMGDKHEAKNAYRQAIHLNPNHAEAQNNLGAIYSEEGHIAKARAHFEAAIAANPSFIEAHYNLSLLKTYTMDDPHLAFLERLASTADNYAVTMRIHYYFALGKALDDTQQYARAFQAYAQGNHLYHLHHPWNKTKLQDIVEQLPQVFTSSFFKLCPVTQETRCPIFIVGMPRAGTTLIEQILASHHSIYGAGELSILDDVIQAAWQASDLPFSTWVSQIQDDEWMDLGKQYLDKTWQLAPGKAFIVDKMPGNCFYVGMIHRMLPTAKIIHALRDPMDSCFSCFTHLFKDRMLFAYDLKTLGEYYALYAQAMQHWRSVLPPAAMFELPYEQLVADHETLAKQLVAYLGLDWDVNCLNFYNHERVVKTASLTQVRKPIYNSSVQRWQHFAESLQPLLDIVTPYRKQPGICA